MKLYQIDTGYACFGIVSDGGKVVDAAPIAGWSLGKSTKDTLLYYFNKGSSISEVICGNTKGKT